MTDIQQHPAVRVALSILVSVARGVAALIGGALTAFVAVLHASSVQGHEELDDNGNHRGDPALEPRSSRPARFASYYEDPIDP